LAQDFYDEVFQHAQVPKGYLQGNGMKTIGYSANGEASDWMLHELGIFALSPELGIDAKKANHFFIEDKETLQILIMSNYAWIENTIKLLFDKVVCEHSKSLGEQLTETSGREYVNIRSSIVCRNRGIMTSPAGKLIVRKSQTFQTELVKALVGTEVALMDCPYDKN